MTKELLGNIYVIDANEGMGKSTVINLLTKTIEEKTGLKTISVREPGNTVFGETVRTHIMNHHDLSPQTEALLFFASRREMLHSVVIPALKRGENVIFDRYYYSSLVFQGFKQSKEDLDFTLSLCEDLASLIKPKKTFILSPILDHREEFFKRVSNSDRVDQNRFDEVGYEEYLKTDKYYRKMNIYKKIHSLQENIYNIQLNITESPEDVCHKIMKHI